MRLKVMTLMILLLSSTFMMKIVDGSTLTIDYVEHDQRRDENFIRLLTPVASLLSGPVWLRLTGIDIYEPLTMSSLAPSQAVLPVKLPYRVPSPKFSRNLLISLDVSRIPYQAETSIAVNPRNPENIVIGMNDYGVYSPSAYVSINGGETWDGPYAMTPLLKDDYGSDVSLAFDRMGRVYFAYMSIGFKYIVVNRIVFGDEKASIVVSRSDDGGFTWSPPRVAALGDIYGIENNVVILFLDRPRIAIGPDPVDKSRDRIYVTYTEFALSYPIIPEYPYVLAPTVSTTIKLVYSVDGGETWSYPKAVSPTYSYILGEERRRIVQGSNPKVGRDGTLYVAYYDSLDEGPWSGLFAPTIVKSLDGGKTFTRPVHIDYLLEMDYELPPTLFRAWVSMMPQIDVGPNGEVYLVVAAKPDDSDIFFYRSLDGGETWSIAKKLNDDRTNRDQFIPAISVSPNGTIHTSWADRRDDPKDIEYHIYYTRSGDRGETWIENTRVTDYPSNPNYGLYLYIGDYFSIYATDEDVYVSWTDTRLGSRGAPNMKIGFARTKHIPLPSILISPPSGYGGEEVTIIGENFIPDKEVYLRLGDAFISVLRTDKDGKFQSKIFMPILSEGPYKVEAIDLSGNRAETYFYCEAGLDTVRKEIQSMSKIYEEFLEEVKKMNISSLKSESDQKILEDIDVLKGKIEVIGTQLSFIRDIIYVLLVVSIGAFITVFIALRYRKVVKDG
ncbi:MAG: exo-alpha-sialidase [Nitrososphaeria archaeon]|nr:exo-alpha-sialidase [Nitrososphaeria archaeon]MDW7987043.1 exo-alpha-sialidase [Nitrososphaerota archaeon]